MADLKKRRIVLSCTLNDKKGTFIAGPGATLTIGDDLDDTTARQLLAGGSARLVPLAPETDATA
jgi:hypothetical protein